MIGPLGTREGAAWERIGLDRDGGVGVGGASAARGRSDGTVDALGSVTSTKRSRGRSNALTQLALSLGLEESLFQTTRLLSERRSETAAAGGDGTGGLGAPGSRWRARGLTGG
jgi:hypothetical protein